MNIIKESYIEKNVCEFATSLGILHYKFTSPARKGVPDRIFFYRGGTMLIEFKRKDKSPTPLQEYNIKKLKEQKIDVYIIDDIDEGRRALIMFKEWRGSLGAIVD